MLSRFQHVLNWAHTLQNPKFLIYIGDINFEEKLWLHLMHRDVTLDEQQYTQEQIEEIDRLCAADVTPPEYWGDDLIDEDLLDIELGDISSHEYLQEEEVNFIPAEFDLQSILSEMHHEQVFTPLQAEINKAVIALQSLYFRDVQKFCNREFSLMGEAMADVGSQESNPEPVKASKLAEFYTKCQQHQTSAQTKASILLMFHGFPKSVDSKVMSMIAYKLHVDVRTHLLKEKEKHYAISGKDTSQRFITESSRGKVRYVGGYCVAKLRHKYIKTQMTTQYQIGPLDQHEHEEATNIVKILDHFRVNESSLYRTSDHVETLLETSRRQNSTRGLVFNTGFSVCFLLESM
ncbi:uncharacterized protein [Argopecten irradians]|uniref:uncharacterized protein n=1 Tax=Argopecten irradians TaxID=31199 RepID=UPI003720A31F